MARTATHAINSNWDYDVEKVPVFTPEGKATGSFMTRRVDNGTILKVGVSKDYNVVQNSEVMEPVMNVLADLGLEPTKTQHFVMGGGARFKARFEFKDTQVEIPKVGDTLGFRLDIDNSFNLMHRIRSLGGALRLVCTNGMQTLEKEFDMLKKHSAQLDLDKLLTTEAIDSALNRFKESGDVFGRLAVAKITQDEGKAALGNLLKKNVFSEKVREGIAHRFDNPTYEEDGKAGGGTGGSASTSATIQKRPPVVAQMFDRAAKRYQGHQATGGSLAAPSAPAPQSHDVDRSTPLAGFERLLKEMHSSGDQGDDEEPGFQGAFSRARVDFET